MAMIRQIPAMDISGRALFTHFAESPAQASEAAFRMQVTLISTDPRINPPLRGESSPDDSLKRNRITPTRATPKTDRAIRGNGFRWNDLFPYRIPWAIIPATMGIIIMLKIEIIMETKGTGINSPASLSIRNGVTNGETMVEQAVIVTDNATFPRAI